MYVGGAGAVDYRKGSGSKAGTSGGQMCMAISNIDHRSMLQGSLSQTQKESCCLAETRKILTRLTNLVLTLLILT